MRFTNNPRADLRRTFRTPPNGRIRRGSVLVFLRHDLKSLYGPEDSFGGQLSMPLLAALGMLSGIELLSKYWCGKTRVGQADVIAFLTRVAGLSQSDAETLIQLRNSLAHGYALGTRRKVDNRPYSFSLDTTGTGQGPIMRCSTPDSYVVNIWSLKRLFIDAAERCRAALAQDVERLGHFQACIRNLGELAVRG